MKNLHEVIELSNAAAKLLSAANERASHQADSLADAMMNKARALLNDGTEKSHPEGDIRNGNVTIGAVEIGYRDDGSVWMTADGDGGTFSKDEFEAAVRQFINERI